MGGTCPCVTNAVAALPDEVTDAQAATLPVAGLTALHALRTMATYSLLFIDANEHIGRSRQIECLTDQQAMDSAAKEPGDYRAVQVWDGDRPIALVGIRAASRKLLSGAETV
jgi:hypothetical protein